jgi:hypothetical protein
VSLPEYGRSKNSNTAAACCVGARWGRCEDEANETSVGLMYGNAGLFFHAKPMTTYKIQVKELLAMNLEYSSRPNSKNKNRGKKNYNKDSPGVKTRDLRMDDHCCNPTIYH